jgi:hypothetical protein
MRASMEILKRKVSEVLRVFKDEIEMKIKRRREREEYMIS